MNTGARRETRNRFGNSGTSVSFWLAVVALSVTLIEVQAATAANDSSIAATQSPSAVSTDLALDKLPEQFIKVPLTRQATDYTCGVSALQSVLAYYGDEIREDQLSKACKSNSLSGTRFSLMAAFAKTKGYDVDIKTDVAIDQLRAMLAQKLPVICLIQAWPERDVDFANDWDDGHYVVAIGYDDKNMYFMDPSSIGNYTYIPTEEFIQRWHDRESKSKVLNHFTMVVKKSKPSYDPVIIKRLG